jgi:hypothetical protein
MLYLLRVKANGSLFQRLSLDSFIVCDSRGLAKRDSVIGSRRHIAALVACLTTKDNMDATGTGGKSGGAKELAAFDHIRFPLTFRDKRFMLLLALVVNVILLGFLADFRRIPTLLAEGDRVAIADRTLTLPHGSIGGPTMIANQLTSLIAESHFYSSLSAISIQIMRLLFQAFSEDSDDSNAF